MRQYIKIEGKRLLHTLPGFLAALAGVLLLAALTVLLTMNFLPDALEVKPFRIGLCVEGSDRMTDYVREYVQQMESTENLVEFQEMRRQEAEAAVQDGAITACIIIPERTAESIMDGTNIPIRVLTGSGADHTERYLQQRLLVLLTECGAVMIDVPQAETLLLYEMQVEDPEDVGMTLDFFHLGLVLDRESWFEEERVRAFGSVETKDHYLAAGLTLLFLFWGLGSGSFFREQEKNLPLLLERRGIPLSFQQGVRQALYILLYLAPAFFVFVGRRGASEVVPLLFCAAMLALQCSFFFQLAPTTGSGILLNGIWGLAGFFGAGGILPAVFLPKALREICGALPAGICMEQLLQAAAGSRAAGGNRTGLCLFWCLFFGAGSQLIFCGKQWSKKRK